MTHYVTLGISKDATAALIKKAYHQLALQYHPDKTKEPGAEERFRAIGEAYEVLSDQHRRRDYDYALEHPDQSGPSRASSFEVLPSNEANPATLLAIYAEKRFEYIFEIACKNAVVFARYCSGIIGILSHRELFFLVQTGPEINVVLPRGTAWVNLGLCNPGLDVFEYSVKCGHTMLAESYDHLTQRILKQVKNRATVLTDIEVTSIFMRTMIFDEMEIETILRNMQLNYLQVEQLQEDLFNLLCEKKLVVGLYRISQTMVDDLRTHMDCQYKKLSEVLFQLKLETKYQSSSKKVIDLSIGYLEERVPKDQSYFTIPFVRAEFDTFSSDEQESFIFTIVQAPFHQKLLDLIYELSISHANVIVDAIFQKIVADICNTGLDPKKSYMNPSEQQLAVAKQKLQTRQWPENIVEKMQFIFELADDQPGRYYHPRFFTFLFTEHAIIRSCKLWSGELRRIFDNHPFTQVIYDSINPLISELDASPNHH